MIKTENFAKIEVRSKKELRSWLSENYGQSDSIWLVTYKKHVTEHYLSTGQVLDELLSFGWIDGIRRKLDENRTMQLIGPRRQQHWSKSYKDRAAKLIESGMMQTPGYKSIERSKSEGLWNFLDDVDALISPPDLIEALATLPVAATFFNNLPDSAKRFTLRWIKLAKTEKTRKKRIVQTAALSQQGKKIPGL